MDLINALIPLLTLIVLETILGIDNIIFISILSGKLPVGHRSFKILALCFLLVIGLSLVAEGLHVEIPKGYIYFAMAFTFLVDLVQMKTVPKSNT